MKKTNLHIEIVCSTETRLSSMSEPSRDALRSVLSNHYTRVGITIVNNLADLKALASKRPDLVFLGMKFIPTNPILGAEDPDKIWVSDFLKENGITHTGSGKLSHDLELNKPLAKRRILDAGLKTALFLVVDQNENAEIDHSSLNFPVFIKPANRGGGLGVDSDSLARTSRQLHSKVHSITKDLQSDSLIEEYLPGREFSVAILRSEHAGEYTVMPIELVAEIDVDGNRMLSGDVKSSNNEVIKEVTDPETRASVNELALDAFHALGARDYGRIDIRMDGDNTPHFLEANLLPSLISGYGSFPKACVLNIGLNYESMVLKIVRLALARDFRTSKDALDTDLTTGIPHLKFSQV